MARERCSSVITIVAGYNNVQVPSLQSRGLAPVSGLFSGRDKRALDECQSPLSSIRTKPNLKSNNHVA